VVSEARPRSTEEARGRSDGILFVAMGAGYVTMALNAVSTLRRYEPSLPVVVVSDLPREQVALPGALEDSLLWRHVSLRAGFSPPTGGGFGHRLSEPSAALFWCHSGAGAHNFARAKGRVA
jgi:hypothetical protein